MLKRAWRLSPFDSPTIGAVVLGVVAIAFAGCGGGGGSAGSGAPAADIVQINGVVDNTNGTPSPNDVVRFNNLTSLTATTDSEGKFALQVPTSQFVANANLWVYNPAGSVIAVDAVTTRSVTGSVLKITPTTASFSAPPPPPSLTGPPSPPLGGPPPPPPTSSLT